MSNDVNPHKVSDATERRAEKIEDKLEKKGMGHDQAEDVALEKAVAERGEAAGGNNSGGEPKKGAETRGGGG